MIWVRTDNSLAKVVTTTHRAGYWGEHHMPCLSLHGAYGEDIKLVSTVGVSTIGGREFYKRT